ncbi:MAG TPA: glycosyltransferase family 39 protein [Patescibacteria group bacterium]|nr:glycosyltransferase family 39 protein [Patescibacteria group bacterium]
MTRLSYPKVIVFLFVLVTTFILRAHNYEKVPTPNHLDEMLYAWSGLSLIETGTPVSWSTLDYPKRAEVFKGVINYKGGKPDASVTLYKPWLDEPPLFSLLVGEFAHLYHADRNQFVPSSYIRMPMVIISTLTSVLVFLIAFEVSGFVSGILAMTIYGFTPIFVFASRNAMPETLIAFLFAVAIFLIIKFWKNPSIYYILPIPILAGIAGLSKPTGFFIIPIAIFMVFWRKYQDNQIVLGLKYCTYLLLATLPFIGFFYWYGFHFDAEIFKIITTIQSNRPVGFASLAWFFISPAFETKILIDGWYIFCLVSAIFLMFSASQFSEKDKLRKIVVFAFVYWVSVVMVSGGERDLLPWYRFPIFPFMAILGAWGIEYILKNVNLFTSFIAVGLLLGNRVLLVNAFHPNISATNYRIIFALLMAPSIINTIFQKKWLAKLSKFVVGLAIITGLIINLIYIYMAFEIECQSKTCTFVPTTPLSVVHFPIISKFMPKY